MSVLGKKSPDEGELGFKQEHHWSLTVRGITVGTAVAHYETKLKKNKSGTKSVVLDDNGKPAKGTQRTWAGKISVVLASGELFVMEHLCGTKIDVEGITVYKRAKQDSVAHLLRVFEEALEGKELGDMAVAFKPRKCPPPAITSSDITPDNAHELSREYGFPVRDDADVKRDNEQQAAYLVSVLNERAEEHAKVPMSDLVTRSKYGEARGSSYKDHYVDADIDE